MVAPSVSMQAGSSEAGSACARLPPMVPRLRIAGWATWATASDQQGSMGCYFRRFQKIGVARQRTDGEDAFLHQNPRNSANSPISMMSSGAIRRRFIAGSRLWPPRQHLGLLAMRGQQFQRICDAGCAGVSESRGFHFGVTSPANYRHFCGIRRLGSAKVKFVVGRLFQTLSLFSCGERRTFCAKQKSLPLGKSRP